VNQGILVDGSAGIIGSLIANRTEIIPAKIFYLANKTKEDNNG